MGLDMYLTRKLYVKNWAHMKPEELTQVTAIRNGKPLELGKVAYIEEEAAYWRKANQVHAWFVANVQSGTDDCGIHYVEKGQLAELLSIARRIKDNPELAPELLPTQGGFFFGSTDYGDYYMEDIEETIRQLTPIVERENDDGDYYYSSSW